MGNLKSRRGAAVRHFAPMAGAGAGAGAGDPGDGMSVFSGSLFGAPLSVASAPDGGVGGVGDITEDDSISVVAGCSAPAAPIVEEHSLLVPLHLTGKRKRLLCSLFPNVTVRVPGDGNGDGDGGEVWRTVAFSNTSSHRGDRLNAQFISGDKGSDIRSLAEMRAHPGWPQAVITEFAASHGSEAVKWGGEPLLAAHYFCHEVEFWELLWLGPLALNGLNLPKAFSRDLGETVNTLLARVLDTVLDLGSIDRTQLLPVPLTYRKGKAAVGRSWADIAHAAKRMREEAVRSMEGGAKRNRKKVSFCF